MSQPTLSPLKLETGISSRSLPVRDLSIHFLEAGPNDGSSPLILLLHGFPELSYSWRKQLLPLASLGYHVVAPDSRGYGRTVPLDQGDSGRIITYDDDIAPFRMMNIVHDTIALVYALGYKSVKAVIGHDFGSSLAAHCALVRPDIFLSVVMSSAPFTGPPSLPFAVKPDSDEPGEGRLWPRLDGFLASVARKHYTQYFTTKGANEDLLDRNSPEGFRSVLRSYFHIKSADWSGNETPSPPHLLTSPQELIDLPPYYVMPANATMGDIAKANAPSAVEISKNVWLTEEELDLYIQEFGRTGFQGGLNEYRCMRDIKWEDEFGIFAGRNIEVPAMFISGDRDWGVHQVPGSVLKMKGGACAKMDDEDLVIIPGAGHWVQQEQPEAFFEQVKRFLNKV
ncbi:Alpha/Beta hydrolase protein [Abortiporus biennis]|nr:Alpha/Beta hydrolase protein [Abortiporus biennis]